MKIFEKLFSQKPEPEIGDVYVFNDGDPFFPTRIEVLDVKGEWILYRNIYKDFVPEETHSKKISILKEHWKKETK